MAEKKEKEIRVGIIGPYLSTSGTVTHVRTLVHGFHQIPRVHPVLITFMEPNSVVTRLKGPTLKAWSSNNYTTELELTLPDAALVDSSIEKNVPITTYVFDEVVTPASFNQFSELIKEATLKENLDVLMSQIKPFILFCSVLAGKKIYADIHRDPPRIVGTWHSNFGWVKDATYHLTLAKMAAPFVDAIIPVSENVKHDLKRHLQLADDKILDIIPPGGIDVHRIQQDRTSLLQDLKTRFGIKSRYIAFLGRHLHNKGVDVLLSAFKILKTSFPDVSLVIMGAGPFTNEYKRIARELSVKDVMFTGHLTDDEVWAILQGATVFCLPSRWESFSISVLEAMAAGCPVVCTNVGGIPYWVGDAARLVPPDDPKTLAQALADVLSNDALRKELHEKSLTKAIEYDWMRIAQKTFEEVRKTVNKSRSVTWNQEIDLFPGDYRFDLNTGTIITPHNRVLINDHALFFPSEALADGSYFKDFETDTR